MSMHILCICFVLSGRTLIIIIIVKANKFRALFFCCECTLKLSTCKRRICHLNLIRIVWELVNAALWPVTPAWFSLTIAQLAQCCQRAKQTVFFSYIFRWHIHRTLACLLRSCCHATWIWILYFIQIICTTTILRVCIQTSTIIYEMKIREGRNAIE